MPTTNAYILKIKLFVRNFQSYPVLVKAFLSLTTREISNMKWYKFWFTPTRAHPTRAQPREAFTLLSQ